MAARAPPPPVAPSTTRLATGDLHGYSVQFSPFHDGLLAVVSGQHYGIAGAGELLVYERRGPDHWGVLHRRDWPDGLFDCCWSEAHEHQVVTASGDGSIQLWDLGLPEGVNGPLRVFKEHEQEVYRSVVLEGPPPPAARLQPCSCVHCRETPSGQNFSLLNAIVLTLLRPQCLSPSCSVHWSQTRGEALVVSGSWDGTAKVWDLQSEESLMTCAEHAGMVYSTVWSPHKPGVFASASADGSLKIWDCRQPAASVQSIEAHPYEVLTCDWNKYRENHVVTGSVDQTVRGGGRFVCWAL